MEQIFFQNFIKLDVCQQKEVSNIITLVIKQISRGRFEIESDLCEVKILLDGEKRTVILNNTITTQDFRSLISKVFTTEPSLDLLEKEIYGVNESLLTFLKKYQDKYYRLGTEFENEYWYKFYSKSEIKEQMRESYQAGWIDYEKQLENGTIIHDELGISGLWAMPYDMLFRCFNECCKNRYGNCLFILKTVPDCRYINDEKEIIGDKFKVIEKYDLSSIEDVGKLCGHLIDLEKNKYDAKESELIKRIKYLENENIKAFNNQKDRKRCLVLLIGIVCGYIICKLLS